MGRIKLSEADLDGVLAEVADLAKRTIPGADEVSVTLIRNRSAHTAAFTGDLALALDEWQYERGHGPCLDAAASTRSLLVVDMTAEQRWPDWARRAVQAGVHSSLSVGLPFQESATGALNIYAGKPDAFDDDGVALAQTFAGYAAIPLANANVYDIQANLARHLQTAMENRAAIEQAKGIVMADRRCSPEEAFQVLSRLSQDTTVRFATSRPPSSSGRGPSPSREPELPAITLDPDLEAHRRPGGRRRLGDERVVRWIQLEIQAVEQPRHRDQHLHVGQRLTQTQMLTPAVR